MDILKKHEQGKVLGGSYVVIKDNMNCWNIV